VSCGVAADHAGRTAPPAGVWAPTGRSSSANQVGRNSGRSRDGCRVRAAVHGSVPGTDLGSDLDTGRSAAGRPWASTMTYKFVGALRTLTDDKPYQRTAIWIGDRDRRSGAGRAASAAHECRSTVISWCPGRAGLRDRFRAGCIPVAVAVRVRVRILPETCPDRPGSQPAARFSSLYNTWSEQRGP